MAEGPEKPVDSESEQTPEQGREELLEQIETLQQELDAAKDKYLRSLADCQNIQKRFAAERQDAVNRGQAEMAKALLAVLDNFERTLQAAEESENAEALIQGVRMIQEQTLKTLGEFGLRRMEVARGDPFNPVQEQAVAHQPSDEVEAGHILHVAQPGYTLGEMMLRPATVVVARPVEQNAETQE